MSAPEAQSPAVTNTEYAIIGGTVQSDNSSATFDPILRITSTTAPTTPSTTGAYCVVVANGSSTLATSCFDIAFTPDSNGAIPSTGVFLVDLPWPAGATQVALMHGSTQLALLTAGSGNPTVSITSPHQGDSWTGTHTLTWTASAPGGATVYSTVLYSYDGGNTWLPLAINTTDLQLSIDPTSLQGGSQVFFKVITTSGISTASAMVGPITINQTPVISAPASVDFGGVAIGQTADRLATLSNTGSGILTIQSVSSDNAAFTAIGPATPFDIPGGSARSVTVRCASAAAGTQTGNLTVNSTDAAHPSVKVALVCEASNSAVPSVQVPPGTLDFGSVGTGLTLDLPVTITNTGGAGLNIGTASATGSFSISAGGAPFVVAPYSQQAIMVRFAPTSLGSQSGTLNIPTSDPARPLLTVSLKGTGVAPCVYMLSAMSTTLAKTASSGSVNLTANSGCYWAVDTSVTWLSITSSQSGTGNTTVAYSVTANTGPARIATVTIADQSYMVTQLGNTGMLTLDHTTLNYAYAGSTITSPQTVTVSFTGGSAGSWTASSNQSNITVSPASGSSAGTFMVTATPGPSGVITVTAPGAPNSPQQITVNVASVTAGNPFGSFDTPANNTTGIAGAVPVTGWTLDAIEVTKVDIWREPVTGEAAGSGPNGLVYIGDAVFVSGARPDVQNANPTLPWNYRAGWGYLMLTNFLPNSAGSGPLGNGTYKLHTIAHGKSGSMFDLGTKIIMVDNVHAAKPFGTLDTPGQGATISGNQFVNFGWALTQTGFCIPNDGSTLTVYVDGAPLTGHPTYNNMRSDIATLFPGLCNSNGAIGYYILDTTKLTNGVHTIFWIAFDDHNRGDGLGSRYINVFNTGGPVTAPEDPVPAATARRERSVDQTVEIEEIGRIELDLGASSGSMLVGDERAPLPIGSSLKRGVFYWHPGPGFNSTYHLVFERPDGTKIPVTVLVRPKKFASQ